MAETVYGFSEEGFRRVRDAVRSHFATSKRGSQRRRQPPILSGAGTTEVSGLSCGSCNQLPGTYSIDLGDGVLASTNYEVAVTCGGQSIALEWVSGLTWDSGSVSVECGGGSVAMTLSMVATGYGPGNVTITATIGGMTSTWLNETAWQPETALLMRLETVDPDCPCTPFQPYPCLVPVEADPGP